MKVLKEIRELSAKKPVVKVVAPPPAPAAVETSAPATVAPPAPPVETPVTVPVTGAPATATPVATAADPPAPAQPMENPPAATPPAPPPAVESTLPVAAAPEPGAVEEMGRAGASQEPAAPPAEAAPPPMIAAMAPVPEIKLTLPEDVSRQLKQSQSFAFLALILAGVSLVSMGLLIVTVRKSDERLRRMVWKSEVDHLRDEVMGGRPHLKVEKSYDRLTLTNTGSVVADDIRLSLGPAPATMKQRLKVLARIEAGEKAEVEIGPQAAGGQIYGTLEYKNPDSGRIYKDQFVLRVDGVTGELIPIQQAS
jgi:hypothetical protein